MEILSDDLLKAMIKTKLDRMSKPLEYNFKKVEEIAAPFGGTLEMDKVHEEPVDTIWVYMVFIKDPYYRVSSQQLAQYMDAGRDGESHCTVLYSKSYAFVVWSLYKEDWI